MVVEINTPVIDPNIAYGKLASEDAQNVSWVRQGMPSLYSSYLSLINDSGLSGIHLDVGTFTGDKALIMAQDGLAPLIGIDIDILNNCLPQAVGKNRSVHLTDRVLFLKSDVRESIPLKKNSVKSITSICVTGTHLKNIEREQFVREVERVLQPGGYLLSVDFSAADAHFYGKKILNGSSKPYIEYYYDPDSLEYPEFKNEKYRGMYNQHQSFQRIKNLYGDNLKLVKALHINHPNHKDSPVHANRFLWESIFQKSS